MARPSKEEEQAVEKYVHNVRKRKMEKELRDYNLKMREATGWKPPLTDLTSWEPKGNHPLKIYKGNPDHWSKIRVQGDLTLARRHLAHTPSGSKAVAADPTSSSLEEAYERRADEMRCLEDRTFPEMIKDCLRPDLPGTLSLGKGKGQGKGQRRKLPDNCFHREATEHDYKYWYTDRLSIQPHLSKKDRNELPI